MRRNHRFTVSLAFLFALPALAQQPGLEHVIGRVPLTEARDVWFSGAVTVDQGAMAVSNGSAVVTADRTAHVKLARGGAVNVCSGSSVQLTQSGESILLSLERGGLETRYEMAKAGMSDVVQTPDLRILISAPGMSDLRIRLGGRGDTCVENHGGSDAAYVSVIPEVGNGLYRVQSGQRVMFEHGKLREISAQEPEPCGCPPEPRKQEELPLAANQGMTPSPVATEASAAPAQVSADLTFGSPGQGSRDSVSAAAQDTMGQNATPSASKSVPVAASQQTVPALPQPTQVVSAPTVASLRATPVFSPQPASIARQQPAPVVLQQLGTATAQPVAATQPTTSAQSVPAAAATPMVVRQEKGTDVAHAIRRFFARLFGRR